MQVKVPFRQDRWDSRHRLACARAFREVPFYREQWAYAGRELPEPLPVRAAELQQELFRLCPLRSPWDPRREPTLWTGDPGALSDALTVAGTAPRRVPVLEVRGAAVDWARVGRYGTPYGFVLRADADVASDGRRLALHLAALKLAVDHGRAVVVGSSHDWSQLLPELDSALDAVAVQWSLVRRMTLAEASQAEAVEEPAVVHDPFLGYIAARAPDCNEIHLLWDRVHAKVSSDGLLFTRLRGRRPTLVNVSAVDTGFSAVRRCRLHGTPVLVP